MKYSGFLASSAMVAMANAHATIFSAYVDDVSQGVGNSAAGYIRSPPNNNPVKDLTSDALTCNVNNVATAKTIDVPAGSKVTLEWHHNSAVASDDIIDPSHKGPVQVYIAPTSSNGAGDVWIKLAEAGYDGTKWAVDDLIANKGKHDVTIPAGLAPGEYLVRGEIIALHEADVAFTANSARGAQLYMECVQIKVTGSGTTNLPAGVAIPGAYSEADPGIVFNLYGSFTSYTVPGPAVWDGTSGGSASASPIASSTSAAPVVSSTVAAVVSTSAPAATPAASSSKAQVSSAAPVASQTPTTSITPVSSSTKDSCKSKSTTPTTLQTVTLPSETGVSGVDTVQKYGRCGGIGYTGATACASGSTCTVQNPYYSQCV